MPTAWPTVAELQAAYESQGLIAPDGMQVHINAAIDRWESLSGWKPYFPVDAGTHANDDTPATFSYDPPEHGYTTLWLLQPWKTITTVVTGYSTTYAGTTQTLNTDYRVLPLNASATGKPIIAIEFATYPSGGWGSIRITGIPGVSEIPEDVWLAVRDEAMRTSIIEVMQGESTASELRQGPFQIKFDTDEGRSKLDRWNQQFLNVARRHMRITV